MKHKFFICNRKHGIRFMKLNSVISVPIKNNLLFLISFLKISVTSVFSVLKKIQKK
jgi:hypothetical protein